MTTTISVIVNGVETQLSTLGALVSYTGWGMPVMDTFSLRAPGQHGDTWGGFSLAPRIGTLTFRMKQTDLDAMYALRARLLGLFSPLAAPILKFVTPGGTRCFQCYFYGDLGMEWQAGDWAAQMFGVQLKAPEVTCYDPVGKGWTFSLVGNSDTFEVPYGVPYTMGTSVINQSKTILYSGTWESFPLIRISGPITDPMINNVNATLDFTGTTIAAGDWYDIDCRYGAKTVKDKAGVNRIGALSAASNLNTFRLVAAPEMFDGVNTIRVMGSAITASTKVDISYFERYLGI